jgi:hypothetical protein
MKESMIWFYLAADWGPMGALVNALMNIMLHKLV